MDLGPHPLPWLIYYAYQHGGQKARPSLNVLRSFVEDFTARTCWLAQRITEEPTSLVAAEAINAHWALTHALSSGCVEKCSLSGDFFDLSHTPIQIFKVLPRLISPRFELLRPVISASINGGSQTTTFGIVAAVNKTV